MELRRIALKVSPDEKLAVPPEMGRSPLQALWANLFGNGTVRRKTNP
jgi:hypothetical protein